MNEFDDILNKFLFGGDYNPEQWPEDTWQDDINMLKEAHINEVTLNVFSWTLMEPAENEFDFSLINKVVKLLDQNKIKIIMATSTAAIPFWIVKKYPDVSQVNQDGIRQGPGKRHNACPSSANFKRLAISLVEKLAENFKNSKSIICWHVSNEYVGGYCYCDNCAKGFRDWLKFKYHTLGELNLTWNTNYWSHTITDWNEIDPPTRHNDIYEWQGSPYPVLMSCVLDYRRFQSDAVLESYLSEYDLLKKVYPNIPITTNFMGFQPYLDYRKWAPKMDIITWDNYPKFDSKGTETAFQNDIMYGLKDQPFLLMEQTPTQQNWNTALKQPGQMRMYSYQSIAHGADSVQFFQMKQSQNATEQYHGGVISHSLSTKTRSFKEIKQLGDELNNLSKTSLLHSKKNAEVAIVFDWENYWACSLLEDTPRNYIDKCLRYYDALSRRHVDINVISAEDDLSKYKLVVAPYIYLTNEKAKNNIKSFVSNGGTFLTAPMSGMADGNNNVYMGGYPGALRDVLGIWIEELDPLDNRKIDVIFKNGKVQCSNICDVIHLKSAKKLAVFGSGVFYSGSPAVTKNKFNKGTAYYVGTDLDEHGMDLVVDDIFKTANINDIEALIPNDIDITTRINNNDIYHFIINTSGNGMTFDNPFPDSYDILSKSNVSNKINVDGYGVKILLEKDVD